MPAQVELGVIQTVQCPYCKGRGKLHQPHVGEMFGMDPMPDKDCGLCKTLGEVRRVVASTVTIPVKDKTHGD